MLLHEVLSQGSVISDTCALGDSARELFEEAAVEGQRFAPLDVSMVSQGREILTSVPPNLESNHNLPI